MITRNKGDLQYQDFREGEIVKDYECNELRRDGFIFQGEDNKGLLHYKRGNERIVIKLEVTA